MVTLQIIFLFGLSGVGKSDVGECLIKEMDLLHLDIDQKNGFGANKIRDEWNTFSQALDHVPLASNLRTRAAQEHLHGVLLSFPSDRILTPGQLDVGRKVGICSVLLWGRYEWCKEARRARELKRGPTMNESRYDRKNQKAFIIYGSPEYDTLRVAAFNHDGSHRLLNEIVNEVSRRVPA